MNVAFSGSEGAVCLRRGKLWIVRYLKPVNKPQTTVARPASRNIHTFLSDAGFLLSMSAAARGKKSAVLFAQIVCAPLVATGVELADSAAGYHQVELAAADVAAGIGDLNDHLFTLNEF